ncbi:hypothetical protein F4806DRAFT_500841 [Annulohypoxylon nitens]|nr:hypothetical protein F4806DRAFT_500841 [Annulohypoxylon nitens]
MDDIVNLSSANSSSPPSTNLFIPTSTFSLIISVFFVISQSSAKMSGQLASQFATLELDHEDDETDEKPFPHQFYRDDGKVFWRYFDFENAHKVDQDWENEVVSIDERQKEVLNKNGYLDRPTYKSKDGSFRKEINYNRWQLFEGTNDPEELRRLADNTWVIKSSLMNHMSTSRHGITSRFERFTFEIGVDEDGNVCRIKKPIYQPPRPMRFYSGDGKLFYRYFDHSTAHTVDHEWNDDVVSLDKRQAEIFNENGFLDRPTYKTVDGEGRKEINYGRWKLFEADERNDEYLANNTWVLESCLNHNDFDEPDDESMRIDLPPLDNRMEESLENI